jgi:hypothetical protein
MKEIKSGSDTETFIIIVAVMVAAVIFYTIFIKKSDKVLADEKV